MSVFSDFMAESGYECKTTFWEDFSIADAFGDEAVKDTFNRAFNEWKDDIVYITELCLVLNHKIWQHYKTDEPKARLYQSYWDEIRDYICSHFYGDDIDYYYRVTD